MDQIARDAARPGRGGHLVALVMIVKDEAPSVARAVESAAGAASAALIYDTGSTDGTPEIAAAAMARCGMDGRVLNGPFTDYASTRNAALDALGEIARFSLFLSGDETLVGGAELAAFCRARRADAAGAYYVQVQFGADRFDSARLARTASRWRYRGLVHEVLVGSNGEVPAERVPGVSVYHDISKRTPQAMREAWRRHELVLRKELAAKPTDPRTSFYLAQTLACLSLAETSSRALELKLEAAGLYERCAGTSAWAEERFHALLRAGELLEEAAPWPLAQDAYLRAHAAAPHRCEPLLRVAYHWRRQDDWATAYLFAAAACELVYPEEDVLPTRRELWDFHRWELLAVVASWLPQRRDVARQAASRAIAVRPYDTGLRERLACVTG